MAVNLTRLFTRLGLLGGGLLDIDAMRGGAATARILSGGRIPTRVLALMDEYDASPIQDDQIDGIQTQVNAYVSAQNSWVSYLRQLAEKTLIDAVNDDTPLTAQTKAAALTELIRQMTGSSDDVAASSVAAGAQTNVGSPTGNPALVMSVKHPNGKTQEYAFAETLLFAVTADAQVGGSATTLREPVSFIGKAAVSDTLSHLWPGGSGCSGSLTCVDSSGNNAGGNLLSNSDFEDFTSNTPDLWTVLVGTPGTTIFSEGSVIYTGAKSLRFLGDGGGTLSSVAQTFNSSGSGTAGKVNPQKQYAFSCWVRVSTTPAAGVLQISLVDSSNTIINDDAGTANAVTLTLSGVSTTFVNLTGVFRTPSLLPSAVKIRVRLSTAISDTHSVYVDNLALTEMTRLYAGGPSAAMFSSSTAPKVNDSWTSAITNTYGGFQKLFERWFAMRDLGLQIPSDGSPSIADALIT